MAAGGTQPNHATQAFKAQGPWQPVRHHAVPYNKTKSNLLQGFSGAAGGEVDLMGGNGSSSP
jgi:hypothetical protein